MKANKRREYIHKGKAGKVAGRADPKMHGSSAGTPWKVRRCTMHIKMQKEERQHQKGTRHKNNPDPIQDEHLTPISMNGTKIYQQQQYQIPNTILLQIIYLKLSKSKCKNKRKREKKKKELGKIR